MACIVLGDSIAVGVGQYRPDCETTAKVGINSTRYVTTLMPAGHLNVDSAVISLGVNDDASLDTLSNLRDLRARITSPNVTWLLPGLKDEVRSMIRIVAEENGDRLVDTRPQVGPDHLHPTSAGYRIIAAATTGTDTETEVAEYEPRRTRPGVHTLRLSHRALHHGSGVRQAGHHAVQHGTQRTVRVATRFATHASPHRARS